MAGLRFIYGPNLTGGDDWVNIVWQLGTYLLTVFLIWWERDSLFDFHVDFLAIAIVIISMPLQTLIVASWGWGGYYGDALAFPKWGSLLVWTIAIGLVLALCGSHTKLPPFRLVNLG